MEALIKSGMQIAQTDFSSGGIRPQDCMKTTQEYLMYFKKFSCNIAENMQARCVPPIYSVLPYVLFMRPLTVCVQLHYSRFLFFVKHFHEIVSIAALCNSNVTGMSGTV